MGVTLGQKYKDTISGFEGTATASTKYLTGCTRILLEGASKDGDIKEYWFDESRLEGVMLTGDEKGGPGEVAPSRDPVR